MNYPFFYPKQLFYSGFLPVRLLRNGGYQSVHACRTGFFHFFYDMAVYVKRKLRGVMSKIVL